MTSKFHLAFKVKDIKSTVTFYKTILGCELGRQTTDWVDFNFFGHQLSAHVSKQIEALDYCGKVDLLKVPIPHFGAIIDQKSFIKLKNRLQKHKIDFIVNPQKRFKDKKEEHQTMFILDFSNNSIEFKSFHNNNEIFKQ
ncbi:VOC family protein [Postechiella marina]|uniref:VOC family protein n=1 Tax=Postechiella marina TaxID=943941 RepID=A0ABP8CB43_9FLAO